MVVITEWQPLLLLLPLLSTSASLIANTQYHSAASFCHLPLRLHCHGPAAASQLHVCCSRECHQCSLPPHFCSVKANCSSVTPATCSHPPVPPVLLMTDVKSGRGRSLYKSLLLSLMLQRWEQGSTGVCYMATEWAHVRSEQSFRKNGGLDLDHSQHCSSYTSHSVPLLAHEREVFPFSLDINNYRKSLVPAI